MGLAGWVESALSFPTPCLLNSPFSENALMRLLMTGRIC